MLLSFIQLALLLLLLLESNIVEDEYGAGPSRNSTTNDHLNPTEDYEDPDATDTEDSQACVSNWK